MRVVPNLYPAFERQEVVIHSPEHVRSFGDLPREQLELVANAWRERMDALHRAGFAYVHVVINEGRAAGASLAHSHSQLIALRDPPPAVAEERDDGLRELLARDDLTVEEHAGAVAIAHPAGRAPYEVLIAPRADARLADALVVLAHVVRRLRAAEGAVPWNAWLHQGEPWHIELVPRLSVFAGIELGAGIWVNTVPPEDAAAALRDARPAENDEGRPEAASSDESVLPDDY